MTYNVVLHYVIPLQWRHNIGYVIPPTVYPITWNGVSAHKQSHIVRLTIATLLRKTLAILLRRQLRATPCGRALACEYRTAGLPVGALS